MWRKQGNIPKERAIQIDLTPIEEGEHVSHIVRGPHEVSTPAAVQREVACGIAVEQGSIADVNVPLRIASASKVGRGSKGQV